VAAALSKTWVCDHLLAGIVGSHGWLSLVSVVCCLVEVSVTGSSLVQKGRSGCRVSEFDREASKMRRPWRTGGCCAIKKIKRLGCCGKGEMGENTF